MWQQAVFITQSEGEPEPMPQKAMMSKSQTVQSKSMQVESVSMMQVQSMMEWDAFV